MYIHLGASAPLPSTCKDRRQPQQLVSPLHDITQSISLHLLMRGKTLLSSWSPARLIIRCQICMQHISQGFMYELASFRRCHLPFQDLRAAALRLSCGYTPIFSHTLNYRLIRLVSRLPTVKTTHNSSRCVAHLAEIFLTSRMYFRYLGLVSIPNH